MDAQSSAQLTLVIRQVLPLIPELAPGLGYTGEGHHTTLDVFLMMACMHPCLLQLYGAHAEGADNTLNNIKDQSLASSEYSCRDVLWAWPGAAAM